MNRAALTAAAALGVVALGAGVWWLAAGGPVAEQTTTMVTPEPSPTTASARPSPTPSPSPTETAEPTLAWGPTVVQWDQALATARQLPLEDAAGQVIVAAIGAPSPGAVEKLVADLHLGGVIIMGDAVTDADGVKALADAAQAGAAGRDWDAIVSVDQEGGTVARLRGLVPDVPSFMAAGAARDLDAVSAAYAQAGVDMAELGFTVDYAPTADVTIGLADPIIRTRSAGSDPQRVAGTVASAVAGYRDGGVVPVLKHFPGHGSVTVDSHLALPVQEAGVEELAERDLVPFATAIDAGAPAIMMGHIGGVWGPEPASVSHGAYDYLRDELAFTGVAFTDALNMGAIQDAYSTGQASVAALAAGADVLLLPPDPRAARDSIVAAVESGAVERERLDQAAARVILLSQWQAQLDSVDDAGDAYARELAIAGATVAAADCTAPFVGDSVTIAGGFSADRDALTRAFEERGVAVGPSGTSVLLLGGDDGSGTADVVVAMGGPWGLPSSTADVYVGLYGRSADALAGLADVLTGAAAPGGDWRVAVDVPYETCG